MKKVVFVLFFGFILVTMGCTNKAELEELKKQNEELTQNNENLRVKETDTLTGEVRFTSVEYDKRHLPIKRTLSSGEGITPVMSAEYRYLPGGEPEAELISDGNNNIVTIYGYKDTNGVQTDSITRIRRIQCTAEELFTALSEEYTGVYGTGGAAFTVGGVNSYIPLSDIDLISCSNPLEYLFHIHQQEISSPKWKVSQDKNGLH